MKKEFTKEEKREYFGKLRTDWKRSKALADNDMEADAMFREAGLKGVSYYGFYFVLTQMKKLSLKGLPYVDSKTFQGWKQNGFKVKKDEKSKMHGVTWIKIENKDEKKEGTNEEGENVRMYPKVYHLFHKTQVEER